MEKIIALMTPIVNAIIALLGLMTLKSRRFPLTARFLEFANGSTRDGTVTFGEVRPTR